MKSITNIVYVAVAASLVILLVLMFPHAREDPDFAQRENIPGLMNFAKLTPGLWRGQAPDENGLAKLREMGVKTIIDFRTHDEHEGLLDDPHIRYIRMPFKATQPPAPEMVNRFLQIATDPNSQPVFFHCRHGKDRTGTMAALFRIRIQGWPPEKAIEEMKYFGFRKFYRDLLNFVRSQKPAKSGVKAN